MQEQSYQELSLHSKPEASNNSESTMSELQLLRSNNWMKGPNWVPKRRVSKSSPLSSSSSKIETDLLKRNITALRDPKLTKKESSNWLDLKKDTIPKFPSWRLTSKRKWLILEVPEINSFKIDQNLMKNTAEGLKKLTKSATLTR